MYDPLTAPRWIRQAEADSRGCQHLLAGEMVLGGDKIGVLVTEMAIRAALSALSCIL